MLEHDDLPTDKAELARLRERNADRFYYWATDAGQSSPTVGVVWPAKVPRPKQSPGPEEEK